MALVAQCGYISFKFEQFRISAGPFSVELGAAGLKSTKAATTTEKTQHRRGRYGGFVGLHIGTICIYAFRVTSVFEPNNRLLPDM